MTLNLEDGRKVEINHPGGGFRPFKGDRLVKVRLYGELAKVAGSELWELGVSSAREALHALHVLTSGMTTKYFIQTNETVRWRVLVDQQQIDGSKPSVVDEMSIERDIKTIEIYPVMEGAGGSGFGIFEAILGAILVVVSIALPYIAPGLFAAGSTFLGLTGASIQAGLFLAGVAALLGGLVSLMSTPGKVSAQKASTANPSYLFSGTVNTQQQGGCVPVAYGNVIIGSQTISAYILNSDMIVANGPQMYQQLPSPFGLNAAIKDVADTRSALTQPWSELGPDGFWGYCNGVTVIPYEDDVPMLQDPVGMYPNGPSWLMRLENGALGASYDPGGNFGPWESLINAPIELDSITLTMASDQYATWAPTPNES